MEGNLLDDVGRRRERGDSGPLFMPVWSTAEFIVRALRIALRVATHISHIAVGAFLPVSISPTPVSVSGSLRSQLSQISQCSTPVSLTSPKNHINQARSVPQSQSEIQSQPT